MNNLIDISGLDKAAVLQVLHAAARRQVKAASVLPITREKAGDLIDRIWVHFGDVYGRRLDVNIGGNELNPRLYDFHNGPGAAQAAIDFLRKELSYGSTTWDQRMARGKMI